MFDYVSREEWGARAPRSVRAVAPSQFSAIEWHHSGTQGFPDGPSAARSFQNFHMDTKGWQDLFYNWLIHSDGTIVEGRSWVTSPRPENYMVVCFIGNYDTMKLTAAQEMSARLVYAEFVRRSPQVAGKAARWHNQRSGTACPGSDVIGWVRDMNLKGWPDPTPKPEPVVETPEPVTDAALVELKARVDQLTEDVFSVSYRADRLSAQAEDVSDAAKATLTRARILRNKMKEVQ